MKVRDTIRELFDHQGDKIDGLVPQEGEKQVLSHFSRMYDVTKK